MRRTSSKAGIHRATVAHADLDHEGAATVDESRIRAHAPRVLGVDGEDRIVAKDVAEVPGPGRRVMA